MTSREIAVAASDRRAVAVVDLGFGDAGKGLLVDAIARKFAADSDRVVLVVRFNGGAQAGHNVVTADGRHHTFAQLGAGTFVPSARTHLAADVLVHPTALLVEAAHLERKGVADPLARLSIDPDARVITPIQQAANRLREMARGDARHGSCGVGIGETVQDALEGRVLRLRDLGRADLLDRLLEQQVNKWTELREARATLERDAHSPRVASELRFLRDRDLMIAWCEQAQTVSRRVRLCDEGVIGESARRGDGVIFEGAQGVLLDETHGFAPHTTWSRCTFAPAAEIAVRQRLDLLRLGVVRMYSVRHGEGPLPTHDPALDILPERHNAHGPWQGAVRRGWPDPPLLRHALAATEGADALAITHLDARTLVPAWRAASLDSPDADLRAPRQRYETMRWRSDADVRSSFASWTNVPIAFSSNGPTAAHVTAA